MRSRKGRRHSLIFAFPHLMKLLPVRPFALRWLAGPAVAASMLLAACNSQPTATEADKTATVVPAETNAASDSAAVTAPASSAQ
jgi:hypothetical protein